MLYKFAYLDSYLIIFLKQLKYQPKLQFKKKTNGIQIKQTSDSTFQFFKYIFFCQ